MTRIPKSIKSSHQILSGPNHILQSLYAKSRDLLSIEATISQFVLDPFSVASYQKEILSLTTPSSSVATRIRYRQRNIIASLRRAGLPVKSLKINVRPPLTAEAENSAEHPPISAESARHIAQTAQYIEDEPLRKALIQLSKRTK